MPLGPHEHALGRQTPGVRVQTSPRTHCESVAHGARKPTHAPASGEPASREATRHTPPPQSSVQMTLPVAGSQPHADGLHSFGSRTHARPGPHCASERHGGTKPAHRLTPLSGARARQMRPPQSSVQMAEPVAGLQAPHAEGAQRRSVGGRHASPTEQSKSDLQGGTKFAHRPRVPASLTPASPRRARQSFAEQSSVQTIPDAVQLQPVCRQAPSSSPRHSMFSAHSASVWQRRTGSKRGAAASPSGPGRQGSGKRKQPANSEMERAPRMTRMWAGSANGVPCCACLVPLAWRPSASEIRGRARAVYNRLMISPAAAGLESGDGV